MSLIMLLSSGCGRLTMPTSPQIAKPAANQNRVTLHQAGEVLSGSRVEHTFLFQNRTDGALWLASHGDIRPSCGCASARVADHRLAPGQTTKVWVQVRTDGRRGLLSEAVSVIWTTEDGRRLEYGFAIRGQIKTALVLVPNELSFDRREVMQRTSKHVQCTSDLPLDWSTATVWAQAEYLEVARRRLPPDSQRLEFDVSCRPSGTGDSRQGAIQLSVTGRSADGTSSAQRFSYRLPVYAADPAPLVVAPRMATLQAGGEGQPWTGRLIVTGDAVAAGAEVCRIRCATGRLMYQSTRIAAAAVRLDLEFWPTEKPSIGRNHHIELELTSGEIREATMRLSHVNHERTSP
jgi:hypothetical protein